MEQKKIEEEEEEIRQFGQAKKVLKDYHSQIFFGIIDVWESIIWQKTCEHS